MYRLLGAALVIALMVLAQSAIAQDQIALNGTSDGSIIFTGPGNGSVGHDMTMSLGSCSLGSNCITGTATGTGAFGSSGTYEISGGGGGYFYAPDANGWFNQYGDAVFNITYFSGSLNLLTGTIIITDILRTGDPYDYNLLASFRGGTGLFANSFGTDGPIGISIHTSVDLSTLPGQETGSGATTTASLSGGQLLPSPEPGSITLFAGGLVVMGSMLRRRTKIAV